MISPRPARSALAGRVPIYDRFRIGTDVRKTYIGEEILIFLAPAQSQNNVIRRRLCILAGRAFDTVMSRETIACLFQLSNESIPP